MSTPRFSVIIPTLNRASELPVAVRSVLDQTGTDFELVIVDDGSTDDTESVVAAFGDARIRYHRQPQSGVSTARNRGAAEAKGDFLIFLDSDDELLPGALARYDEAARANAWDVVVASRVRVSADRHDWHTRIPRALAFLSGGFALSREVFLGVGGYDDQVRYGENTELNWRVKDWIARNGRGIGLVEAPAVVLYKQSARGYDVARYESARRILEHPDRVLEWESVGTAKLNRRRSTYQAIVAVNAARLGRRGEAVRFAGAAIASDPLSWRRYRNALTVVRELSRRRRPESTDATVLSTDPGIPDERPTCGAIHAALPADLPKVLESAADDDWILILDDDGSTETAEAACPLRDFGEFLAARGARVGAVGRDGARFDRRRGRVVPLADDELAGPVSVDYVARDQMLTVRVAAARDVGGFDPQLVSGYDDLDYCERLRRHGYGVYVYGPAALEARRRVGSLRSDVDAPPFESASDPYYRARNLILVMRRHTSMPRALFVTIAQLLAGITGGGMGRFTATVRGCADAWTGRGRTTEPSR